MVELDITRFRNIFGEPERVAFVALFSRQVYDLVKIVGSGDYHTVQVLPADAGEIPDVIASLSGPNHIFCITSDASFSSPSQDALTNSKLGVLPLYSTGFSIEKLERALQIMVQIDYENQYRRSRQLMAHLDNADRIIFESHRFGTTAVLELCEPGHQIFFFNQSGPIQWGRQSVLPNGELSLLTNGHGEYSRESIFSLDGEITLFGYPILHHGSCPCLISRACYAGLPTNPELPPCPLRRERPVSPERQERIFWNLASMGKHASIARIQKGVIQDIKPLTARDNSFTIQILEMFDLDDHYRKVHEIGFGLNYCNGFFSDKNFLPNEMKLGVHFGLGLTPYTEFHLDLACTGLSVVIENRQGRDVLLDGHGPIEWDLDIAAGSSRVPSDQAKTVRAKISYPAKSVNLWTRRGRQRRNNGGGRVPSRNLPGGI